MNNTRLAHVFFWANPEEWDAVDPYVKEHHLEACGAVLRGFGQGLRWQPTWIKPPPPPPECLACVAHNPLDPNCVFYSPALA